MIDEKLQNARKEKECEWWFSVSIRPAVKRELVERLKALKSFDEDEDIPPEDFKIEFLQEALINALDNEIEFKDGVIIRQRKELEELRRLKAQNEVLQEAYSRG